MPKYIYDICNDLGTSFVEVKANSAREALSVAPKPNREDLGAPPYTIWVDITAMRAVDPDASESVRAKAEDDRATLTAQLDPPEPNCAPNGSHEWGNRRAWSRGDVLLTSEVCTRCGLERHITVNAIRPGTGEVGGTLIEYSDTN